MEDRNYNINTLREKVKSFSKEYEYYVNKLEEDFKRKSEEARPAGQIKAVDILDANRLPNAYAAFAYPNNRQTPDDYELALNKAYAELKVKHDANAVAMTNNLEVRAALRTMGINSGLPTMEYYHKTKRSRKRHSRVASWITTMESCIPINDRWMEVENTYRNNLRAIQTERNRLLKEADEKNRLEAIRIKEEEKKAKLITYIEKFKIDANSSWQDVIGHILSKNKYLNLAHWLAKNRADWSDGYNYAQVGLVQFSIESAEDQEIYDEIQGLINNWDGDGRCFRDCHWNFDELFYKTEQMDKELYQEYNDIRKIISDY